VGKTTLVEHVAGRGQDAVCLNSAVEVDQGPRISERPLLGTWRWLRHWQPSGAGDDEGAAAWPETSRIVKAGTMRAAVKLLLLRLLVAGSARSGAESLHGRSRKLYFRRLLFSEALGTQAWFSRDARPRRACAGISRPNCEPSLMQRLNFGSYPEVVTSDNPGQLLAN